MIGACGVVDSSASYLVSLACSLSADVSAVDFWAVARCRVVVFDGGPDYIRARGLARQRAVSVCRDRYARVSTRPSIVGDADAEEKRRSRQTARVAGRFLAGRRH